MDAGKVHDLALGHVEAVAEFVIGLHDDRYPAVIRWKPNHVVSADAGEFRSVSAETTDSGRTLL
jgi:hypothetical protein